jgi:quercetin 2,3-dioxygenase
VSSLIRTDKEPAHFYQVWRLPRAQGLPPTCKQKAFVDEERRGKLRLVASPTGKAGALTIRQDARIYLSLLDPQQ